MRSVGKELGARYVMEGSLRQAGTRLRIAVQLVDASSGAHLWAETYDRPFRPEADLRAAGRPGPRIVSTVADTHGVLPHSMSEALREPGPDQLSPYEAVLRSFALLPRITAEEHAAVRAGLERAVERFPSLPCCSVWDSATRAPDVPVLLPALRRVRLHEVTLIVGRLRVHAAFEIEQLDLSEVDRRGLRLDRDVAARERRAIDFDLGIDGLDLAAADLRLRVLSTTLPSTKYWISSSPWTIASTRTHWSPS